jgi:hypothetical protein
MPSPKWPKKLKTKTEKNQAYKTRLLYQALPSANNAFKPSNAKIYRK